MTPIWSALFAHLALGEEGMGPVAWAGAILILFAGLLASGVLADKAVASQVRSLSD